MIQIKLKLLKIINFFFLYSNRKSLFINQENELIFLFEGNI